MSTRPGQTTTFNLATSSFKEALDVEIGKLQPLSSFDLTNTVVRQKLTERYGNAIPLNENVISPAAMFGSDQLITVVEK